jgi:protein gp37
VAARFSGPGLPYEGLAVNTPDGPRWTGEVRLIEEHLNDPLRWKRPRRIFVNSMSDLFHEKLSAVDIGRIFNVMGAAKQHTFQVLTKRPERMRDIVRAYYDATGPAGSTYQPYPNVWLGVSTEDQATVDDRIPFLLDTPAAVRWVSYEPALGPVTLPVCRTFRPDHNGECLTCDEWADEHDRPGIDWVVIGGESGPGARPFDLAWARTVIAQCKVAGVPVFMKQMGADPRVTLPTLPGVPIHVILKDRKGGDVSEWAADLRVRDYPEVAHGLDAGLMGLDSGVVT